MAEKICASTDIPEGSAEAFTVDGEKMLVFHLSDGFYATQLHCTHLFWSLKGGKVIDDRCVQCSFHHARFNIRNGEVEQWASRPPGISALNAVRPAKALKTWPVHEQDGQVYLGKP